MSITRPPTLSQEEMDRLLERLANTGAKITMADPRVTSAQTWVLLAVGAAAISVAGWGVNSINNLNVTMARVVTQIEGSNTSQSEIRQDIREVKEHIRSVDGRVQALERKVR